MTQLTHEELTKLEEYAQLDGTEIGEMLVHALGLYRYTDYIGHDTTVALEAMLRETLEDFEENWQIVEEPQQITRTIRSLEPKWE